MWWATRMKKECLLSARPQAKLRVHRKRALHPSSLNIQNLEVGGRTQERIIFPFFRSELLIVVIVKFTLQDTLIRSSDPISLHVESKSQRVCVVALLGYRHRSYL